MVLLWLSAQVSAYAAQATPATPPTADPSAATSPADVGQALATHVLPTQEVDSPLQRGAVARDIGADRAPDSPEGAPTMHCTFAVPEATTSAMVMLTTDIALHDQVPIGKTCRYSAGVRSGTYVLSLTGIVGAARLRVFSDAAYSRPLACLAPTSLANASFAKAADCTFIATGGRVYATVTGTRGLAGDRNRYSIRLSPRLQGGAAPEGTLAFPKSIVVNTTHGGTVGPGRSANSYYVVNAAASAEVVISLTGLTGTQAISLQVFDNRKFERSLIQYCDTAEFAPHPVSCVLPGGKAYFVEVRNQQNDAGGPYTLMVEATGAAHASPTASTRFIPARWPPAAASGAHAAH
jgi:hypothetical protein